MDPEAFDRFQEKVDQDNLARTASFRTINRKLDDRHRKKEAKKAAQENCATQ